jgi:hypothetical protein
VESVAAAAGESTNRPHAPPRRSCFRHHHSRRHHRRRPPLPIASTDLVRVVVIQILDQWHPQYHVDGIDDGVDLLVLPPWKHWNGRLDIDSRLLVRLPKPTLWPTRFVARWFGPHSTQRLPYDFVNRVVRHEIEIDVVVLLVIEHHSIDPKSMYPRRLLLPVGQELKEQHEHEKREEKYCHYCCCCWS